MVSNLGIFRVGMRIIGSAVHIQTLLVINLGELTQNQKPKKRSLNSVSYRI